MTETMCRYGGEREQVLVSFLYDEIDAAGRADFEAHLTTCPQCRRELASLRALRPALRQWTPPEPVRPFAYGGPLATEGRRPLWRRLGEIPVWTQVAAALLVLGVSAGVSNLDVRYDHDGVSVRTGWSRPHTAPDARDTPASPPRAPVAEEAPWRAELASLETRLRAELRPVEMPAAPPRSISEADLLRRVQALIDESEHRQQRELALRVADVMHDVDAQRRADLSRIDRNLGLIQNNTGVEVMKQRELLNYLVRVSQNK
jgi:putative zinc finger protein